MKTLFTAIALTAAISFNCAAQQPGRHGGGQQQQQQKNEEMKAKLKEEAAAYYANADTAEYGVRYRFKYKYNKARNLSYEEDRMVLIRPEMTLDMSYEGMGENRWRINNPDSRGGDPSLAYHLTPSYYFYYPETGRMVQTYRIIAEEFKLSDSTCANKWDITSEEKKIGEYNCRKATLEKDGRKWTAWFTTDLPHRGAPRTLAGLPGVVLEASDADGEVCWMFNGLLAGEPESKLYIKCPDTFSPVSPEKVPKIVRMFALSDGNHLQSSGVMDMRQGHYPEKYRPSTGIHALNIDNPIERR